MKKLHIVLILLVAVVSGILVMTYASAVDAGSFHDATLKAGKQIKVTGTFDKTQPVEYDALKDANLTIFYVVDKEGESRKVYLRDKSGKPMGLEQSESVTIEGKMGEDGNFEASHLLMKCPSKYNEQKHALDGSAK
jgi:cytochrome c-type biogenesis protein CcmE